MAQDTDKQRHIGLTGFIFVAYFWVSGGMYGTEDMVTMAPPLYLFLCLVLCPLMYAIPTAIISCDLSTAYPVDGGLVSWIDIAFGPTIGAHNMYWVWFDYILGAAVYPVMAGDYMAKAVGGGAALRLMLVEAVSILMLLVRLFRFDFLVRFNTVLTVMSVVPALMFMGATIPYIDPAIWFSASGNMNCNVTDTFPPSHYTGCDDVPMQFSQLLPYVMWLWSGFFSIGSLAGEVKNPRRNIPLAMMILTPFVFLEFTLPLALSISINHNQSDFSDGYFTVIARQAAGKWLDILITIVAVTTMIGTGNGALIVGDEALQSFLVRHQPGLFHSHKKRSAIHHWLVDIDNRVAPSIVFLNSAILIVCALLPLDLILSSSMVVFNVSILVFLVAYVKLKRNAKGIEWLFSFGWMSALVLTLFPCSFTLFMTYEALFNYPVTLGIPYINVVATVAIVGVGLLVHLLYKKASGSKAFSKAMRNMMLVDSVGSNMHELVAKHEEEAEDDDDEQQEAEDAALMSRSL